MNAKLKEPKFAIGAAVAAGLLVVVAGWMLLVSPAKSKASKLDTQVQSTQAEIATRRAAIASKPKIRVDVRSSDLFRLTKAVPGQQDMPLPEPTMRLAISSPDGPGTSRSRTAMS